ncbi:hypothetical protein JRC04_24810 [Mycolicibacterium sp. S2-37]|uniref:hypothetical protein n=1 Tax=Mycolicibacterium sp. S2-37 TaxID=2810297 RepID=UPI001A947118|nr:hypothetical protein [Mycolicibacterium sp. S2-37]MBO0680700.1 hypothetical protein [Mycolicibacterium sp. S2-37]
MNPFTNRVGLRRALTGAVASTALAAGLLITAPASQADILDQIGAKYMAGEGGGQVSKFIEDSLRLRSMGARPSAANLAALQEGWDFLPNQSRLVEALQGTIAYQRKIMAQGQLTAPGTGPANKAPAWVPPGDQNPFLGPEYDINPYA